MRRKLSQTLRAVGSTLFSLVLVALFVVFALREKDEVLKLREVIAHAQFGYVLVGLAITAVYIYFHSQVYEQCLRAIGKRLPFPYSTELFLKRYFVSAFIPTGFSLSQFTFSRELDRHGIAPLESHFASLLYLLIGAVAYIVMLFPTLLLLIIEHKLTAPELYASLFIIALTLFAVVEFFIILQGKGLAYRLIKRVFPDLPAMLKTWQAKNIHFSALWKAFGYALLVESAGILLLWITFAALNVPAGLFVAVIGYVITILVLTFSPLFQGLGLVEISLVYGLTQFGLSNPQAVTVTLLFRFFQLLIPFSVGGLLYLRQRTKKIIGDLPDLALPS